MDNATSHWQTGTIRGASGADWFYLLEFFPTNVPTLRISASNDTLAYEGSTSQDELGATSVSLSQSSKAWSFLQSLDSQNDVLSVRENVRGGYSAFVRCNELSRELELRMEQKFGREQFVKRIMTYVGYSDAELGNENDEVEALCKRKDELLKELNRGVKEKIDEDETVSYGLRLIMDEKRKYKGYT